MDNPNTRIRSDENTNRKYTRQKGERSKGSTDSCFMNDTRDTRNTTKGQTTPR